MQVIFVPSGTGPSRSARIQVRFAAAVVAGVLVGLGAGSAYLGYVMGHASGQMSHQAAHQGPHQKPGYVAGQTAARLGGPGGGQVWPDGPGLPIDFHIPPPRTAGITDSVAVEQITALRASLEAQREVLHESRRRLSDHYDSLGQRLGRVQAHVSRLNALGQRLTDMADLDRDEFSFDTLPALGGPERPGPWARMREPELAASLDAVEQALRDKENDLSVLEALLTDRELHQKQYPLGWPTSSGWVSSAYGQRTDPFTGRTAFHDGVDIAARDGTEIRTMAAGVVSFAGSKPGYGLVVEVNHGNGYETRYAHAREIVVKAGDRLEKGDTVALVGSTGRSTGSHVHVEVLRNGEITNPHDHLKTAG